MLDFVRSAGKLLDSLFSGPEDSNSDKRSLQEEWEELENPDGVKKEEEATLGKDFRLTGW